MEQQPFYFELEDQLKMFITAIDGCNVRRFSNRVDGDKIAVRYTYAPKQRALHDLLNKAQHITLPVVAFWIKNISYDPKREFNKIDGSDFVANQTHRHLPQPLPVKIELDLSVLAKFQTDIDQIISNLAVYFRPYIIVSWERFNLPWHEIRNKITWSGNIGLTYPIDINDNQPTRVTADTSFTIEGWLFKEDDNASGLVRTVHASFHALSSISNDIIDLNAQVTPENTENETVSGNPLVLGSYPSQTMVGLSADYYVYGTFLGQTSSVYISTNTVFDTSSAILVSAFNSIQTLSADNPPFYGIPVDFTVNNENSLTVYIPPPLSAGYFDIIVLNPVGYGKLTDDTTSPFASGVAVFSY